MRTPPCSPGLRAHQTAATASSHCTGWGGPCAGAGLCSAPQGPAPSPLRTDPADHDRSYGWRSRSPDPTVPDGPGHVTACLLVWRRTETLPSSLPQHLPQRTHLRLAAGGQRRALGAAGGMGWKVGAAKESPGPALPEPFLLTRLVWAGGSECSTALCVWR